MDDARFWIWEKQRGIHSLPMRGSTGHNLNTTDAQAGAQSLYDVSWEERAFAEDAAGPHGGCIWPPRSYSCNFCGREFRSAQALGGHMNVHRRDRARLKQSSLGSQDVFDHNHQPSQQLQHGSQSQKSSVTSHVATSQVCDLAYNSNPNPNHVSFMNMTAPTSLALKISSPSAATGYISLDQEPSTFDEDQLGLREAAGKLPWSNQNIQTTNLKMDANKRGPQILREGGLMHCDKPDISVSLNLFLFQTQATKRNENESTRDDDHHQDDAGSKRRKITATESSTMSSSYTKSRIVVDSGHDVQQKLVVVPGQQSSSSFIHEQLDLELRLGERSKVK